MATDLIEAASVGGLDLGRGNDVQLVMMTGEITGLASAGMSGVRTNGAVSLPATSITVDTTDATTKITVGDRLFKSENADGTAFAEVGVVTSVGATTIGISAGLAVALGDNDELFVASEYDIDADGTITLGGNPLSAATTDLVLTQGAGQIVVKGVNLDSTTAAANIDRHGIGLTMEFTFGKSFSATDSLNLIGAVGDFGWDQTGGTVGSAVVSNVGFGSCAAISGNKVEFHVGLPYENEGGGQVEIIDGSVLKFCIMGIAKSDGV